MKWNKSLDAVKEVFYDDSMDAFKEAIVNRTRKSTITPSRSWIKYTKRQPCAPMYGRLYHYAGNNPVRYIDPTGNYVILNESQHERTDNFIKSQHSDSRYLGFGNEKSVSFGYYFSDMYGDNPQQLSSLKTSKAPSITMSSVFGSMSSNTSEDVSMNGTLEQGFKFVDEYKKGKTRVSPKVSAKILGQKDGKVAIQVIINNRGKIYKGIVAYAGLSEVQTDKEFDKTKIDKIANDSINFLRGTDNETKNLTE